MHKRWLPLLMLIWFTNTSLAQDELYPETFNFLLSQEGDPRYQFRALTLTPIPMTEDEFRLQSVGRWEYGWTCHGARPQDRNRKDMDDYFHIFYTLDRFETSSRSLGLAYRTGKILSVFRRKDDKFIVSYRLERNSSTFTAVEYMTEIPETGEFAMIIEPYPKGFGACAGDLSPEVIKVRRRKPLM